VRPRFFIIKNNLLLNAYYGYANQNYPLGSPSVEAYSSIKNQFKINIYISNILTDGVIVSRFLRGLNQNSLF